METQFLECNSDVTTWRLRHLETRHKDQIIGDHVNRPTKTKNALLEVIESRMEKSQSYSQTEPLNTLKFEFKGRAPKQMFRSASWCWLTEAIWQVGTSGQSPERSVTHPWGQTHPGTQGSWEEQGMLSRWDSQVCSQATPLPGRKPSSPSEQFW